MKILKAPQNSFKKATRKMTMMNLSNKVAYQISFANG